MTLVRGVTVSVFAVLASWRPAVAQCPDGTPPPCAAPRAAAAPERAPAIDPNVVAILPFRITGADPSLGYLRDGMVELLAAEFTGEGGPRAVDPGTALRAWERAGGARAPIDQAGAVRVARQVGAGQLLVGAVVGTPRRMSLTASIVRVPGGDVQVPLVRIEGDADSLGALVGRLAAQLLARGSAAWRLTGSDPSGTSADALRAYISGRAAYRVGDYAGAGREFGRALDIDSTFAQAAYAQVLTSGWSGGVQNLARARNLAWSQRDRLGPLERGLLEAFVGDRFPAPFTYAERLALRERVASRFPTSSEAWYVLGDEYFHRGAFIGYGDATARSRAALERSLALDTTAGVLSHLFELAVQERDRAAAARYAAALESLAPNSDMARGDLLINAVLHGDAALARSTRAHPALRGSPIRLAQVALRLVDFGLPLAEAESLLALAATQASTEDQRGFVRGVGRLVGVNAGRLHLARLEPDSLDRASWRLAWEGLANPAERADAARTLAAHIGEAPRDPASAARRRGRAVVLGYARLAAGDTAVGTLIAILRDSGSSTGDSLTASALEGIAASERTESALPLASVDSLARRGSPAQDPWLNYNLARAFARRGDFRSATAAVRRRRLLDGEPHDMAAELRDGGRWAALAGDTAAAIADFRHYLVLRADPDPAFIPERDSIRAELARLERRKAVSARRADRAGG